MCTNLFPSKSPQQEDTVDIITSNNLFRKQKATQPLMSTYDGD